MNRRAMMKAAIAAGAIAALGGGRLLAGSARGAGSGEFEFTLPDSEWKRRLSPMAYRVLRHEATERPFSSPLNHEQRKGIYACAGCDLPLYSSDAKYDSGTGWPSFWKPLPGAIGTREDRRLFTTRIEVHCRRCGGHLGHVFKDGPPPTGLRYCMNGVALKFIPA